MIILITASLSSNTYNKASWCEDWKFEGTQSMLFSTLVIPCDLWSLSLTTGLSGLSGVWIMFPRTETIRSRRSRAGIPSNLNPASKEMISDSVELCETEVFFSFTHPTYWNKCVSSKNAQCSSRSGFWIFKISCEVRVLKQSQSALFWSTTLLTLLFIFTCVMDVGYQTIQSFVTGFGPFCNRSCKFIHWP